MSSNGYTRKEQCITSRCIIKERIIDNSPEREPEETENDCDRLSKFLGDEIQSGLRAKMEERGRNKNGSERLMASYSRSAKQSQSSRR